LKLDQVSTGEAAEVMAINALAPFILNGRLRGLMERTRAPTSSDVSEAASAALDPRPWPKFVVNVSAMVSACVHACVRACGDSGGGGFFFMCQQSLFSYLGFYL
jgi:NAD(P)-dependent dehydrogenase (short-subunit alcohol dehydrogenase family)